MDVRRLRRIIERYGSAGVLVVGTMLLFDHLWRQRRARVVTATVMLALAPGLTLWSSHCATSAASSHAALRLPAYTALPMNEPNMTPNQSAKAVEAIQGPSSSDVPHYKIVRLGSSEVAIISSAYAINQSSEVVGNADTGKDDESSHAFHWKNGKRIDLGTINNLSSSAKSINNAGLIAGLIYGGKTICAVVWKNGKIARLPLLPGYDRSSASGINDKGQIAGQVSNSAKPRSNRACRWDGGKVIDLGTLPGGRFSQASKINSAGQIVGHSSTAAFPDTPHACLWRNGEIVELAPPGTGPGLAIDINEHGAIVGYFQPEFYNPDHAFLFQEGKLTDLGTLPGRSSSRATGINNKGQVIGMAGGPERMKPLSIFLWSNGKMVDLTDRIPANSGWSQLHANAINDRGEIVGNGLFKDKKDSHETMCAFLLVPVSR